MTKLTVFEMLLHSTVKLTVKNGDLTATGTGFFYAVDVGNDQIIPLLVSNKHVLSDGGLVSIWCHRQNPDGSLTGSGKFVKVDINISKGATFEHPDREIDICAIPFADVINQANAAGEPILFIPLDKQIIPTTAQWEEFDAMEEVIMIGCPNGIYDNVNHNPIIRRGITASPLSRRYMGKPEFLIDMACFPGSSGSPVVLVNQIGYRNKSTGDFLMDSGRTLFLGVLYAGPLVRNQGQIILGQTPHIEIDTMMHLGNVIRSSEVIVLEDFICSAVKTQNKNISNQSSTG